MLSSVIGTESGMADQKQAGEEQSDQFHKEATIDLVTKMSCDLKFADLILHFGSPYPSVAF